MSLGVRGASLKRAMYAFSPVSEGGSLESDVLSTPRTARRALWEVEGPWQEAVVSKPPEKQLLCVPDLAWKTGPRLGRSHWPWAAE